MPGSSAQDVIRINIEDDELSQSHAPSMASGFRHSMPE